MQANYDAEVDVLRIRWSEATIEGSDQDQQGIILDYEQDGSGVEIENVAALHPIVS